MCKSLYAPKLDNYISGLSNNNFHGMTTPDYDQRSLDLIEDLFSMMRRLKKPDERVAELWIRVERGPIEAFGNVKEWIEDEFVETEEKFYRYWQELYPDEVKWYSLSIVEEDGYKGVFCRHRQIIEIDPDRDRGNPDRVDYILEGLNEIVRNTIKKIEQGTYIQNLEREIPPQHRTGTIVRKDYWDIFPENREDFLKDITQEDINEFIEYMKHQDHNDYRSKDRLQKMTAGDFYRFCELGYKENNYRCVGELSAKDLYYVHADGRDEGLKDIDIEDPDAFKDWLLENRVRGGHPWEVCSGGNSTHISLYVGYNNGYYLTLAGSSLVRTIETVKFYLALKREGLPVFLSEGNLLMERFLETEKIGVVPEGIIPVYCSGHFPDEHIISFMNLPDERTEEIAKKCVWQPLKNVQLYY